MLAALLFLFFMLLVLAGTVIVLRTTPLQSRFKPQFQYRKKEFLMSPTERSCYEALSAGLGSEYYIFPQIHLDCLLEPSAYGREHLYAFRHINQKSVDFVLCDRMFRSVLAIELDDRTHERVDRVRRDSIVSTILRDVGVPLLRIKNQKVFDMQTLTAAVRAAIPPSVSLQEVR